MMKLISTLMVALGAAPAAAQAPGKIETINSKSIRFTVPTVATDDLKFVMPTAETFKGAPQFHEDEWAQLEFFPTARLADVQRRLVEYKSFEQSHRDPNGWTDIYARRVARSPVLSGASAVEELASKVHAAHAHRFMALLGKLDFLDRWPAELNGWATSMPGLPFGQTPGVIHKTPLEDQRCTGRRILGFFFAEKWAALETRPQVKTFASRQLPASLRVSRVR